MKQFIFYLLIISLVIFFVSCNVDPLEEGTPEPTEDPTPVVTAVPTPTPADEFGTGADGALNVNTSVVVNSLVTTLDGEHQAGRLYIEVGSVTGLSAGDELFIYNSQGTGAGTYEFVEIARVNTYTIDLESALFNTYPADDKVFIYYVPQYTDVIIQDGGTITANTWNALSGGGVVVFRASGSINISGTGGINVSEKGYRGHNRQADQEDGFQGEGYLGIGIQSIEPNANGGGGGRNGYGGGGGGGHANQGTDGIDGQSPVNGHGLGGLAVGNQELTTLFFGGAGGTGGDNDSDNAPNPNGGHGAGIIYIASPTITIKNVLANGGAGKEGNPGSQDGGSGGGAGGSICIIGNEVNITGDVTAIGGIGFTPANTAGGKGGDGSVGRIRIRAATINGVTIPAAYMD